MNIVVPKKSARDIRPGDEFGRLTVVARAGSTPPPACNSIWLCRCSCGGEARPTGSRLVAGQLSCGCLAREQTRERKTKHGHCRGGKESPEYWAWIEMIRRCTDPAHASYHLYADRGIAVCPRWSESFEAFLEDMGPRPSPAHSLDRIDNDAGYGPTNCRWATDSQQQRNKRNNRRIEFRGRVQLVVEWAEELGWHPWVIRGRLSAGWSVEKTLTTPPGKRGRA